MPVALLVCITTDVLGTLFSM